MYFVIVTNGFGQSAVEQFEDVGEATDRLTECVEKGQSAQLARNIPFKIKVNVEVEM